MVVEGIKFVAPEKVAGRSFNWKHRFEDGEIKNVPDDISLADARELKQMFPDRFELIETDKPKAPAPSGNEGAGASSENSAEGNSETGSCVGGAEIGKVPVPLTSIEKGCYSRALKKLQTGKADTLTEMEQDVLQKIEDGQPSLDGPLSDQEQEILKVARAKQAQGKDAELTVPEKEVLAKAEATQ